MPMLQAFKIDKRYDLLVLYKMRYLNVIDS